MPASRVPRQRLDQLLVERGLAESRTRAQALILAGRVRVGAGDAARLDRKAGDLVDPATPGVASRSPEPYVSRGGHKLAAALDAFGIDPTGRVALDAGASTGGFTDVLLQRGAARVYAVDVGRGQLAEALRRDPRVVSMERLNARTLAAGVLPEPVGTGGHRRLVHLARPRARPGRGLSRAGRRPDRAAREAPVRGRSRARSTAASSATRRSTSRSCAASSSAPGASAWPPATRSPRRSSGPRATASSCSTSSPVADRPTTGSTDDPPRRGGDRMSPIDPGRLRLQPHQRRRRRAARACRGLVRRAWRGPLGGAVRRARGDPARAADHGRRARPRRRRYVPAGGPGGLRRRRPAPRGQPRQGRLPLEGRGRRARGGPRPAGGRGVRDRRADDPARRDPAGRATGHGRRVLRPERRRGGSRLARPRRPPRRVDRAEPPRDVRRRRAGRGQPHRLDRLLVLGRRTDPRPAQPEPHRHPDRRLPLGDPLGRGQPQPDRDAPGSSTPTRPSSASTAARTWRSPSATSSRSRRGPARSGSSSRPARSRSGTSCGRRWSCSRRDPGRRRLAPRARRSGPRAHRPGPPRARSGAERDHRRDRARARACSSTRSGWRSAPGRTAASSATAPTSPGSRRSSTGSPSRSSSSAR